MKCWRTAASRILVPPRFVARSIRSGGRGHEPVGVERGLPGQDAPGVALRDHGEGVLVPVGRVHPSADGVERPFRHRLANAVPAPEFSQRLPVGDHHAGLPSKAI